MFNQIEHLRKISKLGVKCAAEVWHKKREQNIKLYNKSPKLCKTCNSPIKYDNRRNDFCSRSCAAKTNNIGKRRHGKAPRLCKLCDSILDHSSKGVVCKRCLIFYNIKNKELPGNGTIRQYLLMTREYKCSKCGLKEWLGLPIPLESHHIDGNKRNNNDENLELICPNCHVFTDTYKVKNRKDLNSKKLK